jgi:uncharacterized membrane protein
MTRWLLVSVLLTVAAFAASLYIFTFQYDRMPDRMAIHWNIHGDPDGWVNKDQGLWVFLLLPGAMALMVLLTVVLPWLSPRGFDPDRFRGTWEYVMMLVVGLFGYIHALSLIAGMQGENPFNLGKWLIAGMFLFFAFIGNVMGQVRRNFWMGVRTPWTLASESVWNQTHRFTAWLFVIGGVVGFVAVIVEVPIAWCFIVFIVALVAGPILYSLVLYKRLERLGRL